MIKKIKASFSEKILLIFLIILGVFTFSFFYVVKNKCLFVKNHKLDDLNLEKLENIAILNVPCGNVIIQLYPNVSPNSVKRFRMIIENGDMMALRFTE